MNDGKDEIMQATLGIREQPPAVDLMRTLLLLAGWFFLAVWMGVSGVLVAAGAPPFALGATIILPLLLFALDSRFGNPLFGGLLRLDLPALIALHTFRILGVIFVVAWSAGTLPAGFALPAGLGDVAVGLSAPFVAAAVAQRRRHYTVLARFWTLAAIADLVVAVTSGILHAPSPIGVLAGPVTTDAMARYPLSLIPSFLVPLALLLHLCALGELSKIRAEPQPAFASKPGTSDQRMP